MKKFWKLLAIFVATTLLLLLLGFFALFGKEVKTLASLEAVDGGDFFTMTYAGDYGFDDFLKTGASTDGELIDFVSKQLLKGIPVEFSIPDLGCSTFSAQTPEGDTLFGRNFDLPSYCPGLLVETAPEDGYRSLSMVNLGFLGYGEDKLPTSFMNSLITLAAPYAPLDGVNEKGVAIGVLLIDTAETNQQTDKVDLTTTTAIRLVLDQAATTREAVSLLQAYDMHSSAGSSYHFQITDATGDSVVVEYVEDVFSVVETDHATNFLLTPGDWYNFGHGQDRYQILDDTLSQTDGVLNEEEAMGLLGAVSSKPNPQKPDKSTTQWSVVYDTAEASAEVVIAMDYAHPHSFDLDD
ncbi:MAG: C45 family peptidase [Oscillospiraceae bacterium]